MAPKRRAAQAAPADDVEPANDVPKSKRSVKPAAKASKKAPAVDATEGSDAEPSTSYPHYDAYLMKSVEFKPCGGMLGCLLAGPSLFVCALAASTYIYRIVCAVVADSNTTLLGNAGAR